MLERVGVLANPTARGGRGASLADSLPRLLRAAGHDVHALSAASLAEGHAAARAAIDAGTIDVLLVAGGDGMVHVGANLCAGTSVPIAVCASGSGNDNARSLGLPIRDAPAAVALLRSGQTRRYDVGRRRAGGDGSRHTWLGVLSAGFDSIVNERANRWRWPRGPMRYNLAMLRELAVFRPIPYRVEVDGQGVDTRAMLVAVGNGPAFGGGMQILPGAVMDDGLLDILILHEVSIPTFLRVFPSVFSGRHVTHPAVQILRGRQVRLEARGITAYADGERFGALPLDLHVAPGALHVVVPRAPRGPHVV